MESERKFIIDDQIVKISQAQIKHYYAYPECFVKEGNELYVFTEKIYVSEDGDYCSDNICTLPKPEELYDMHGKRVCACAEDFALDSVPGFIYNGRLYFINFLQEIQNNFPS